MPPKEPQNPFEEINRKVEELMRDPSTAARIRAMAAQAGQPPDATAEAAESGSDATGNDDDEETQKAIIERIRGFNLKPREIRDHLNRFVIKQNEAKRVLSVAICDHYNHVRQLLDKPSLKDQEYHKQNIVLLGPTGVGKTYLMRCAARLIGVPFVKADATKFSETGYVGSDVEDLVRDLVKMANGDVELAQYGIIYIDEIDKVAGATNAMGARDVSGRGVQINLLKLMEETEVNVVSQTDMFGQMQAMMEMQRGGKPRKRTINTRHILFIVSGAFDKLAENVKKRLEASAIGFARAQSEDLEKDAVEFLSQVTTQDLIQYGFEPEFVGRLPVRVACAQLREEDLVEILQSSEGNILEQYRLDFAGYGIEMHVTPEALRAIARRAAEEKTGARGLMTVLERIFRGFKFELPSAGISRFEITAETVENPERALLDLLEANETNRHSHLRGELDAFAERFHAEHELTISFSDEAARWLITQAIERDETIRSLCERHFKDLPHGLQIIARNTEQTSFTVDEAMAADPDKELSRLVVASFHHREKPPEEESSTS